ncbi:MAG TPA: tetratricopeptide repeat protein [Candidatus Acidoferrum sp.]|nr:tetratricopeptide repeat protein [Candidatus Acidoferrum sp.]
MARKKLAMLVTTLPVFLWLSTLATGQDSQNKDELFRSAVSLYESGKYAEAVAPLEKLVKEVPETFEVQELLGLVYAAQSEDAKANAHLAKAVRLNPRSVEARSNLAANYARLGKMELAQEQFAKAAELDPNNYETNHNLGEIYIRQGTVAKALPYLEKAQKLQPAAYDNGYDLSLAYMVTGRLSDARASALRLLQAKKPPSCTICSRKLKKKTATSLLPQTSFNPPPASSQARPTSSIGAASFSCTAPSTPPCKSLSRAPSAIPIRPGSWSASAWPTTPAEITTTPSKHF